MAARRIRPYRQGRLDGLCGIYALINALRLLCPRLNEDACEAVFCALIKARARQTASPLAVISHGTIPARVGSADRPLAALCAQEAWDQAQGQTAQSV